MYSRRRRRLWTQRPPGTGVQELRRLGAAKNNTNGAEHLCVCVGVPPLEDGTQDRLPDSRTAGPRAWPLAHRRRPS